jgi:hypothetical protein
MSSNPVHDSPAIGQRMENVATYSEARSEYTKQLATFIVPALVGWFQQMWARNASDRRQCLALFQGECEEIARWNVDRVHDEVRVLIERSGCDYMEELVTAVFVAHTKVLTAVRLSAKEKKLSITVPKLDHFIHRIFRETARAFWKAPFLFMDVGTVVERQKNVLQIEALATEAITTAVRGLLPVKQILRDYLDAGDQEELEDDMTAAATIPEEPEQQQITTARPTLEVEELLPPKPVAPAPVVPAVEASAPAPAVEEPVTTMTVVKEGGEIPAPTPVPAPEVVKIDTEPTAVHFSDYDDVYEEDRGEPEIRFSPKSVDDEEEEGLEIDESSARPLSDDLDLEDLEKPAGAAAAAVPPSDELEIDELLD